MSSPISLYSQSPFLCYCIPPAWNVADQIACASVGQIQANGLNLGCGVLIGIDRVLVPAHVIEGVCSDALQVSFYSRFGYQSYWALTFFIDEALDLAMIQLDRAVGQFPGQSRCFPRLHGEVPPKTFLLGRFDQERPYSTFHEGGHPCYTGNFCSFAKTEEGCSGSGYFDQHGRLFALHLSRSNGSCANVPKGERKAVLVSQIMQSPHLGWILNKSPCSPLPLPRKAVSCAPDFYPQDLCVVPEGGPGGRPAPTKEIQIFQRMHKYWEYRPNNPKGPGPRGLTMSIPHQRKKVTYRFDEQPHGIRAYNKGSEPLYEIAAQAFKDVFEERGGTIPERFTFDSHLGSFGATILEIESFGH